MNVFDINSSNCVTFEIFPRLKKDDFDFLILFLENKRQSGGGDIIDSENLTYSNLEDGKLLKIWYQDSQVAQRVISKKFLKFKNYYIRSLPGTVSSFKRESFHNMANKLIIQNITNNDENDEFIVQMFAEFLAPENEVINLQKLKLSADSFLVSFKEDLNKEAIFARFNKKKYSKSTKINLMDSFSTNSLIVFSQKKDLTNFDRLIEKLNSELANIENFGGHFLEYNSFSMLVQFDDEKLLNEIFDFLNLFLKSTNLELSIEKVFNFNLVEHFSVQNESKDELEKSEKFSQVGVQINCLPEDNFFLSSNVSKSSGNHCSESEFEFKIDQNFSLALMKNKKLFLNLQEEFKKVFSKFELNNLEKKILIKFDINEWKKKSRTLFDNFVKCHYKNLVIPSEIIKNSEIFSKLSMKLKKYCEIKNANFSFEIDKNRIHLFGSMKDLKKKSNEITHFMNYLVFPTKKESEVFLKNKSNEIITNSLDIPVKKETEADKKEDLNKFRIIKNSLLYEALCNINIVFNDLNIKLKQIGAKLQKMDDNFFVHQTDFKISNSVWNKRAITTLKEFEETIIQNVLEIPKNLKNENGINLIKAKMVQKNNSLLIQLTDDQIRILGYKKLVKKFYNFISKNHEIENICINKSKIIDYVILSDFNGRYFKEFSIELNKIDATLAAYYKNDTDNGFRILCNLEKNEQNDQEKVKNWNQKVLECRKNFFSKFTRQIVQLPKGKTIPNDFPYDPESLKIDWKNDSQVEIIGEKNDVKRVVQILVKKKDDLAIADLDDQFNNSNPNKNTFIINDLKWFQISILFEEEFFKQLSVNFKKLKVMLNTDLTKICLSGKEKQIAKAKKLAFEILNKIMGAEIECDLITLENLRKDEQKFSNFLKEQNLKCVIDHKSYLDRFIVYSTRFQDIEKFKSVFSNFKF